MKLALRMAVITLLSIVLSALGFGQVAITTSTAATTAATLPAGSFAVSTLGPGPNTVTIDIAGTYTGQFSLAVAYQGPTSTLRVWPNGDISNVLVLGTKGIAANATGSWSVSIPGQGKVYLIATSLASGTPTVLLSAGFGASAKAGKPTTLLAASQNGVRSGLYVSGAHALSQIVGENSTGTTYYLQIYDSATLPADGTVPIAEITVAFGIPTAPTKSRDSFTPDWVQALTGVYFVWSSVPGVMAAANIPASGTGLLVRTYGN